MDMFSERWVAENCIPYAVLHSRAESKSGKVCWYKINCYSKENLEFEIARNREKLKELFYVEYNEEYI